MEDKNLRKQGLNHSYLDEKQDLFSNIALGLLCRSLGYNLRIAYFNKKKNSFSLVDFFYKLHLKNLDFFPFDSFDLSIVKNYDLIIFDNFSFNDINYDNLRMILEKKDLNTEFVVIFNNKFNFNEIKDKFDLISKYLYKKNSKGNKNISIIYGNGKGKSTYSFGFILRKLLEGEFVKLIYFDKGGDFYGEKFFFNKLKKVYKKFQFFSYGKSRFDGNTFRFKNNLDDLNEAKNALEELNKSYDEHIIIADEINTCINSNLLSKEEVISNLEKIQNSILITGRCENEDLINLSYNKIEVKEIKHYSKKGFLVRKGIDF